jgi:hypothetical protein
MRKAKATYNAPKGDDKVVEMGGVTFFDGHEVELNSEEHPNLLAKLPGNPYFDIEIGEDDGEQKPRRGRPPGSKNKDAAADQKPVEEKLADQKPAEAKAVETKATDPVA